jgi:hypothetical protein
MKNVIKLFLIVIFFGSCAKDFTEVNAMRRSIPPAGDKVSITCAGSCGDRNCQVVSYDRMKNVECTCNNCAMTIKFIDRVSNNPNDAPEIPAEFSDILDEYVKKIENVTSFGINQIEYIAVSEDEVVVIFDYEVGRGKTGSVMLSKSGGGSTFVIDCTGTCDCRERYNFATKSAECTCADCKMTVTEVKETPTGGG